ncbi:unnamed protein product, partial [Rotaria sordida]
LSSGCMPPYVATPSGNCVNILIDINNCDSIGYICPFNYVTLPFSTTIYNTTVSVVSVTTNGISCCLFEFKN